MISVVMPAYNAEPYIEKAIQSVIAQTYQDWELIIYNDASTDSTYEIALKYANLYSNIHVYTGTNNGGSELIARNEAIKRAVGEWISPLDADDWIEPTYLAQLLEKAGREHSEIVYPTMWVNDERPLVPQPDFDYKSRSGRDAIILTLNGLIVGTNGGIIMRKLCKLVNYDDMPPQDCIYSDEVFDREVMFLAKIVSFSEARYFYRSNPDSVTHRISPKKFDHLITDGILLKNIRQRYEPNDITRIQAECHRFNRILDVMTQLAVHKNISATDRKTIWKMITDANSQVNYNIIRGHVGPVMYSLMKYLGLKPTYTYIKLREKVIRKNK